MTATIDDLLIQIDASSELLRREVAKADGSIERFERSTNRNMKQINSHVDRAAKGFIFMRNLIGGFAVGFGLHGLAAASRSMAEFADTTGTAADQANIAVERYQTLREGFRALEVDGSSFDKILQRLILAMGNVASGAVDESTKALDMLGISAKITRGEIGDTADFIDALAEALARVEDPAARAALAGDIVGTRLGTQLAAVLADGGAALHELEQQFFDTGNVIEEANIKKLAEANEVWDSFVSSIKAKSVNLFADFITELHDAREGARMLRDELGLLESLDRFFVRGNNEDAANYYRNRMAEKEDAPMEEYIRLLAERSDGIDTLRQIRRAEDGQTGGLNVSPEARADLVERLAGLEVEIANAAQRAGLNPAPPADDPLDAAGAEAEAAKRKAAAAKQEAERVRRVRESARFETELDRGRIDNLKLEEELAGTHAERAAIAAEILEVERRIFERSLETDIATGQLSEAQAAKLRALEETRGLLEAEAERRAAAEERAQAEEAIANERARADLEVLDADLAMAETQAARRDIMSRILDLETRLEESRLEQIIASESASEAEIAIAQERKRQLARLRGVRQAEINAATQSPLERHANDLTLDEDEIMEKLERITVDGLGVLEDGLARNAFEWKSWGDVIGDTGEYVLQMLTRLAVQMAIIQPLTKLLTGGVPGGGGGGIGGFLGGLFGGGASLVEAGDWQVGGGGFWDKFGSNPANDQFVIPDLPKLNRGGSFDVGGLPGVDRNVLAINGKARALVSDTEKVHVTPLGQGGPHGVIEVRLDSGMLQAVVLQGAIRVQEAAAPGIMEGGAALATAQMTRPSAPGGGTG
jgi:hypothetical protein